MQFSHFGGHGNGIHRHFSFGHDYVGKQIGRIILGVGGGGGGCDLLFAGARRSACPGAILGPDQMLARRTRDRPLPTGSDYIIGANWLLPGYSQRQSGGGPPAGYESYAFYGLSLIHIDRIGRSRYSATAGIYPYRRALTGVFISLANLRDLLRRPSSCPWFTSENPPN